MTKIYTKTGDSGQTSLLGKRVEKDCLEITAIGDVDELNAIIGTLISFLDTEKEVADKLATVQNNLFVVGANLAAVDLEVDKVPQLKSNAPAELEDWIDEMEGELESLRNFILPGGCQSAAQAFYARAVCRRVERSYVMVQKKYPQIDDKVGQYLNRLSDVLFVLGRFLNKKNNYQNIIWKK